MRLTTFTDFGLRLLMRMAGRPDMWMTTGEIAAEFNVSHHHLTKVVRSLTNAGILQSRRGAGGGIRLARPAAEIRIGEVVRLLEDGQALVECFRADGGTCTLTPHCRLKSRLAAARESFLRDLDRSTLADCAYPAHAA